MNSPVSADQRGVPSMALALMAWRLAGEREGFGGHFTKLWEPCSRQMARGNPGANRCSAMYYRIIDCIAFGHQWQAEKEFATCTRCHTAKAMRDFKPGEYHRG